MKKWIATLLMAVLTVGMAQTTVAEEEKYFDENENKVFDNADLFSDIEEEELSQMILDTSEEFEMDVIIVTTDDSNGKTAGEYADDFYDTHKFGYEAAYGTGVLLLIDMDNREVYISTSGLARVYLDEYIEDILDEVQPPLTRAEYYESAVNFNDEISRYARKSISDDDNSEVIDAWNSMEKYDTENIENFYEETGFESGEKTLFSYLKNPLISGIISIAVGGIVVLIMSFSAKTKNTVNSRTYLENGSFNLLNRQDRYTHTTTTKRKIESSSSSGGSGGGGGHSHGGGGRSF